MTELRYPAHAMAGDYARAALGLGLVVPPLVLVPLGAAAAAVLGTLAALFGVFAVRTAVRQSSRIVLGPERVAVKGLVTAELPWSAVERVKLDYFSTRRDGRVGWMQLKLAGGGRSLTVDSRLDGFEKVAAAAAEAARRNGLALSAATAANFGGLGIAARDGVDA